MASLWHVRIASITALGFWGHAQVRKHCSVTAVVMNTAECLPAGRVDT